MSPNHGNNDVRKSERSDPVPDVGGRFFLLAAVREDEDGEDDD